MSKRLFVLSVTAIFGLLCTFVVWTPCVLFGHCQHQHSSAFPIVLTIFSWAPFIVAASVYGVAALVWRFKTPDIVITVAQVPTPLMARFHAQDARLERRERLKGELFKLNGEIETFNADLTADERGAWLKRLGPYGK